MVAAVVLAVALVLPGARRTLRRVLVALGQLLATMRLAVSAAVVVAAVLILLNRAVMAATESC